MVAGVRPGARWVLALCGALAITGLAPPTAAATDEVSYADFDSVLIRHVRGYRVDYGALMRDRAPLDRFLAWAASARPDRWERDAQIAFWVNVYNARVLGEVLRHPGLASVLDANRGGTEAAAGFFKVKRVTAGRALSLDEIENDVLRKRYAEPRIHFVLNCASASCPPLPPRALTGATLERGLEAATRAFLADTMRNRISPAGPLELSAVFKWYEADFVDAAGSIQGFIESHWPGRDRLAPGLDIRFLPYDWSLNGDW